jgi:hypothetical protein
MEALPVPCKNAAVIVITNVLNNRHAGMSFVGQ